MPFGTDLRATPLPQRTLWNSKKVGKLLRSQYQTEFGENQNHKANVRPAVHERGEVRSMELRLSCLERQPVQFLGLGVTARFFSASAIRPSRAGSKRLKRPSAIRVRQTATPSQKMRLRTMVGLHFMPVQTKVLVPGFEEPI
jgi:hypothetical protein